MCSNASITEILGINDNNLVISMKIRLKKCKIVKNILTYYIGAIK